MIIGIVGSLGAGKGTVVEYLKEKGFSHYSVSGELTKMLTEQGKSAERKNLSALSDEVSEKYAGGMLQVIYERISSEDHGDVILESIHRENEADFLRSEGAIILGVDADVKVRYERAISRKEGDKDNVTYEQFLEDIAREEEGKGEGTPNIRKVLSSADFTLQNDGTLEDLYTQIDEVLKQLEI